MEKAKAQTRPANEIDMLHGPLLMKILWFALPLAASNVMQQLFNSVDVAVVGHFASSQALAAVGSNGPVINLLINLFTGLSMGANIILSNHIGQNDRRAIADAIGTIALTSLACGLLLLVVGVSIARPVLTLMGTPADVLDMAVSYLRIYFLGMPFFMVFNFGASILRSRGDTRRPLYILIIAGLVNTVLNLVFVICFHMGVEGVAIATGIANAVSAVLIVLLLLRDPEPFRLHLDQMRITWIELKRMMQMGIPAGLQGMVFSFSNVLLQSAINGYGWAAMAGSAAALNFECYCYFLIAAFNGAAITFIGQNYGAGQHDRVRRIFRLCMLLSVVVCGAFNGLFVLFNNSFLNLFSTDAVVHTYGTTRMTIVLAFQWVACSYEITGSALRGMGKSMLPTLITVFGTCMLRIGWLFLLCPFVPGFAALMTVYPVSWVVTGVLMLAAYALHWRRLQAEKSK